MTAVRTVKVSKELYERLCEVAGELQVKLKRRVSLNEAMEYLLREKKLKVSDFAGVWSMSDEEEEEILKSLRVRVVSLEALKRVILGEIQSS